MLPDGMTLLSCRLPAVDAMRIDGVLESTARALRAGGDARTLDQSRTDTLRDLVLDGVVVVRGPTTTQVPVTCDATTRLTTAEDDGAPDDTRSDCDAPSPRNHRRDVPSAAGHAAGTEHARSAAQTVATTTTETLDRPCPRPHATAAVHVAVALTTLLGLDADPATRHGYGPISADRARGVAHRVGSTWRWIVTDPATGAVLDVGRTRYPPPRRSRHMCAPVTGSARHPVVTSPPNGPTWTTPSSTTAHPTGRPFRRGPPRRTTSDRCAGTTID